MDSPSSTASWNEAVHHSCSQFRTRFREKRARLASYSKQTFEVPSSPKPLSLSKCSAETCCRSYQSRTTFFREQRRNALLHAHLSCCTSMYGSRRVENLWSPSLPASCKIAKSVILSIQMKVTFLRPSIFVSSSSPVFRDGTVSRCTA